MATICIVEHDRSSRPPNTPFVYVLPTLLISKIAWQTACSFDPFCHRTKGIVCHECSNKKWPPASPSSMLWRVSLCNRQTHRHDGGFRRFTSFSSFFSFPIASSC